MRDQLRPGVHRIPGASVPPGWRAVQLCEVSTNIAGGRLGLTKQSHYRPSGTPAFSAAGQDGFVERKEFRGTDGVVLSAIGANCGRCFLAGGDWTTLANTQAIVPRVDLDARYLFYRINREDYWPRSGSAQPFIKPSSIGKCWLLLPPLPEQRRIAEILDTLDEAIRKTEQVIAKLQQMKQGLLHDLLTRGIDDNGELRDPVRHPEQFEDSALGRIPKGWEVHAGISLFTLHSGTTPSILREDAGGRALYLKVDDFNHPDNQYGLFVAKLTFDPRPGATGIFSPGALVFPKRGAAIFQNRVQVLRRAATIDPNLMVLQPHGVLGDFLCQYLRFFNLSNICDNSGLPQINNKHLYPLRFAIPPADEQERSMSSLRALEARTEAEHANLAKLRTLKHGLMDDLLTGRVRVKVPKEDAV